MSFKHAPNNSSSQASVERASSALRQVLLYVKTDFCSIMGEVRLNALILVRGYFNQ